METHSIVSEKATLSMLSWRLIEVLTVVHIT